MEIARMQTSGGLELRIRGRLDGYWADHLKNSLAETMREGHDRIRLELSGRQLRRLGRHCRPDEVLQATSASTVRLPSSARRRR
jgi:hypothetical protein